MMVPDSEIVSSSFSGRYYISDMNGKFIKGYRVENGIKVSRYILRTNQNASSEN